MDYLDTFLSIDDHQQIPDFLVTLPRVTLEKKYLLMNKYKVNIILHGSSMVKIYQCADPDTACALATEEINNILKHSSKTLQKEFQVRQIRTIS